MMSLELSVSIIAAITAIISVLFLSTQVSRQAKLSQGQLIEALSQDVDANIYMQLALDELGELHETVDNLTTEQRAGIISFLTFFERLNVIIELNLVPLKIFNELYAHRFFLITHNINVQRHVLLKPSMRESWVAIFRLHKKWLRFRKANKMRVPLEGGLAELQADAFYQAS